MPPLPSADGSGPVPMVPDVGTGLKAQHVQTVLESEPDLGFFEVHTENYMGAGGPPHRALSAIRDRYPLSLHGVGLSLGSAGGIDAAHLAATRAVVERYQPALVSEHLSFSVADGVFLNDLVPLPYTDETLDVVCDNVSRVQDALGRAILVENPSSYLHYVHSSLSEQAFLTRLCDRTGCGLLLDVNNAFVSAHNLGFDAQAYVDALPLAAVGEIHLAGHAETVFEDDGDRQALLIDDHGAPVCEPVWALYAYTLARTGPVPTLVERDSNIPPFAELVGEAHRARAVMNKALEEGSHACVA